MFFGELKQLQAFLTVTQKKQRVIPIFVVSKLGTNHGYMQWLEEPVDFNKFSWKTMTTPFQK